MTLSQIIGVLSLIATVLTAVAAWLETIKPQWAAILLSISGAISAFTRPVLAKKPSEPEEK